MKGTFAQKYLLAFNKSVLSELINFSFKIQRNPLVSTIPILYIIVHMGYGTSFYSVGRSGDSSRGNFIEELIRRSHRHQGREESSFQKIKEIRKRPQSKTTHFLGLLSQQR